MNTETIGVLIFVGVVFSLFYYMSNRAEKWVKESYEEKRRTLAVQAPVKSGKRRTPGK